MFHVHFITHYFWTLRAPRGDFAMTSKPFQNLTLNGAKKNFETLHTYLYSHTLTETEKSFASKTAPTFGLKRVLPSLTHSLLSLLFLTCFIFYAPLGNIRIREYTPPPIREFLDVVNMKKYVKNMKKYVENMWNIWRNMGKIWRNMWRIWRHMSRGFGTPISIWALGFGKIPNSPPLYGSWDLEKFHSRTSPWVLGLKIISSSVSI